MVPCISAMIYGFMALPVCWMAVPSPEEDRSRGARYNSALRFTAEHDNIMVVVVSSDRPVSIIQEGIELSAQCKWEPISSYIAKPVTLEAWAAESGI